MITIQHKRLFRKPIVKVYNTWNECSQDELLVLFKIMESNWYDENDRLLVADFISTPEVSDVFPIKKIKKFYGPADQLRTMTFGQWAFIERKMFDLSQENSNANIQSLMACIFIPKNKIFNPEMSKKNKKYFKGLSKNYYNAAVRCWDAQRRWIYSQYEFVFPTTSSDKSTQPCAPKYVDIMRRFAVSPADVEIEKIFNSTLHTILSAWNEELRPKKKS